MSVEPSNKLSKSNPNHFMAEENNAATPVVTPKTETPVVAPATPASEEGKVTLTKEEHNQLVKDAGRASANQSKADRFDRLQSKGGGHFSPPVPVTPPTQEEKAEYAANEDRKAERGLLAIAADPAFREVFDADPTLRNLIMSNPLAVLPMYANDALDADDAISLVKDALTKLKKPVTAPVVPPVTPPATPPAGGINPDDKAVDAEYEAAKKIPNTESALAGMIKAGMKRIGGKK